MRKQSVLLVGAAVAALAGTWVLAQPFSGPLSGQELINLTTSGGSGIQVPIANALGMVSARTITATTGTQATAISDQNIILTGVVTALTVTLPNPANTGEMIQISNSTGAAFTTALTVTTAAGSQTQSLNTAFAAQTLAAGSSVEFVYVGPPSGTGVWYRTQ